MTSRDGPMKTIKKRCLTPIFDFFKIIWKCGYAGFRELKFKSVETFYDFPLVFALEKSSEKMMRGLLTRIVHNL